MDSKDFFIAIIITVFILLTASIFLGINVIEYKFEGYKHQEMMACIHQATLTEACKQLMDKK